MIKIDKNVPVPSTRGQSSKFPFGSMEVGDSFDAGEYTPKLQNLVTSAAVYYRRNHAPDAVFISRKTEGNRLRVWRTK